VNLLSNRNINEATKGSLYRNINEATGFFEYCHLKIKNALILGDLRIKNALSFLLQRKGSGDPGY